MSAPAVALRGITRRCGTVLANHDISMDLAPGETHALVGENGAGKTTLMRVLYGLLKPDAGTISLDGRPVTLPSPAHAMRLGLGMVHQHFMLVDTLTVAENITLGREPAGPLGVYRRDRAEAAVAELAERYRLPVDPRAKVRTLSVGAQQRVEILKALYHGARVLILDEPTAVLTPHEVDELFVVLRALQQSGTSIVLITHKLGEVKALAQRVTVLRAGRVVGGGAVADLSVQDIAALMVGKPIAEVKSRGARAPGAVGLAVRDLEVHDARGLPAVRGVSFDVRAGEIVGLAGVEGNGQHELIECLAGLQAPVRGSVTIAGHGCGCRSAREHRAAGLAHIPSDRLRRGLVPDMTLAENLALGIQRDPSLGHGPVLDRPMLERHARPLIEGYDVRPTDPGHRAGALSGGNQQKLIAARELSRERPVVIAAHPTRGVDLGAVAFLHRRLLDERDAGRAVLLVSSELSEILALSDRVLVMYEGRIVLETRPADTTERALGLCMTGRATDARAASGASA